MARKKDGKAKLIYVGMPCRPGASIPLDSVAAIMHPGDGDWRIHDYRMKSCSLLPLSFNQLWCEALNERRQGVTHFCMVHDDLALEPGWLATLVDQLDASGADVVSAVIPLKDDRGLTSTGVMDPTTRRMKKFSLHEALSLPPTFGAEDAGYPGHVLLMNTGLWLARITDRWAERVVFRLHDTVQRLPDGTFRPACVSEDWLFSVDCWRWGLRTRATTAVKVKHCGRFDYPNFAAWGSREDEDEWAEAWNVDPPAEQRLPVTKLAV